MLILTHHELDQLPEGTQIQVRPIPLAFAYRKLGGRWTPIESDLAVYEPQVGASPIGRRARSHNMLPSPWLYQVGDNFPLGTIAIEPNGIGHVKGFAGCAQHPTSIQCLCVRSIRWLRAGRVVSPFLSVNMLCI